MHLRPFYYLFTLCFSATAIFGQTITGFTPSFGAPGDPIRIDGTGFTGATEVDFNGHPATFMVTDQSGTQINAYVPATSSVGYNYITVKKSASSNTSTTPFTIINSGPYIDSFPQSGGVGSQIVISGAHFTPFASGQGTITFNGAAASYFAPTDDNHLTVIVPAAGASGKLTATATASGLSWTSTNMFFYPPGAISFSPANGRPGTNVVIKGTNFFGVTNVAFGGYNAIVYTTNSNTQITATVPEFAVTAPVHIFTPGGHFVSTSNYFVTPNIVSYSPYIGDVGTTVTIKGTNLNGTSLAVFFNGVKATLTSTNFNQLTAIVPNNAMSGAITVQSSDGTTSTVTNFYMPPSISSISPTIGPIGSTVTINGKNLTNAISVQFNGVDATSFTVVTNTKITAVVPPGPTSGYITVTTPAGTAQSLDAFFGAPVINAVTPPAGVIGVDVTIFGTNFFGTTNVMFNGVTAPIRNQTPTNILTTVPFGATTGPITVQTIGGNVNSSSFFIEPLILSIANVNATKVMLSWTTNAPGFSLQEATNVLSTNTVWFSDTNSVQVVGGKVTVTNDTTGVPQKIYRLRK